MLAGNLASIGVGGIVAVVTSLIVRLLALPLEPGLTLYLSQWPDNFDFEATRAINKPTAGEKGLKATEGSDNGSKHELEKEKDPRGVITATASVKSSFDAVQGEDELDPIALTKAFKFATWSSLGLVCCRRVNHAINFDLTPYGLVRRDDHRYPSSSVLRLHNIRNGWSNCMGGYWDHLDVLFCYCSCSLPTMGESGCTVANRTRNCKGMNYFRMCTLLC
jgi:hypothetical protein